MASDAGGLADLVDEEIGFCFRAGDVAGCRAALRRFVATSAEGLELRGRAAATRVSTRFTPEIETAGYLAVLRETLANR